MSSKVCAFTHPLQDNGHLTATNQVLQSKVQESAGLAERFTALENQYKAMSLVVLANPENKDVTQVILVVLL